MKSADFKVVINRVKTEKDNFIDYLMYCGWFFLGLTPKQNNIFIDEVIRNTDYYIQEDNRGLHILYKNGLKQYYIEL